MMGRKRKWTQYSDEDKASAVLMLEVSGYPDKPGSMAKVVRELGVPESTLRDWAKNQHGAPPANVRANKKGELIGLLKDAATDLVKHLIEIASTGDVRETATALGIIIDKLQILSGEPTENINQRILVEYFDDADTPAAPAGMAS